LKLSRIKAWRQFLDLEKGYWIIPGEKK